MIALSDSMLWRFSCFSFTISLELYMNATKREARDCYLHLTKKETEAQILVADFRSTKA